MHDALNEMYLKIDIQITGIDIASLAETFSPRMVSFVKNKYYTLPFLSV